MTCGRNYARVLGVYPIVKQQLKLTPVNLPRGQIAIGVSVGRFHTCVWTKQSLLFTFGCNAGQLGQYM